MVAGRIHRYLAVFSSLMVGRNRFREETMKRINALDQEFFEDLIKAGGYSATSEGVIRQTEGDLLFETNSDSASYLVFGGSPRDFNELEVGNGLAVPPSRSLAFDTVVERAFGISASFCILEYDSDRKRIGEVVGAVNETFEIRFSLETAFILPCIRLSGVERLLIRRVLVSENLRLSTLGNEAVVQPWGSSELRPIPNSLSIPRLLDNGLENGSYETVLLASHVAFSGGDGESQLPEGFRVAFAKDFRSYRRLKDREMRRLFESKILNPAYYQSLVGRRFENDFEAAKHFLAEGLKKGISPNPLLEFGYLSETDFEVVKEKGIEALLAYLRKPRTQVRQLSEFFDASLIEAPWQAEQKHVGGALGWFIENAKETDYLPSEKIAVRWGDFKDAVWATSVSELESRRFQESRVQYYWSHGEEVAFKSSLIRSWLNRHQSRPLVSVVMPTWNRSGIVTDAIKSVLSQTYGHFELIVVDDGSTDDTAEVVKALAQYDDRIRFIQSEHCGVCRTRNVGLKHAQGRYIAFLDSDNKWSPDFLELMVAYMETTNRRFGYAGLSYETPRGEVYRCFVGGSSDLKVRNHIDLNVVLIARELVSKVNGFDESLKRWVDHDLVLRISKYEEPAFVPFIGCKYENSHESIDRITTTESEAWQWIVISKEWASFSEASSHSQQRVPGRVSICMPMFGNRELTRHSIYSILRSTVGLDVEIILVDNGSPFDCSWRVAAEFAGDSRVRYHRLPRNMNFSIGSNFGAKNSTGEFLLFLNNDTEVRGRWLEPLLQRLDDRAVAGVQPLLLFDDDSIQSAGTAFVADDSLPVPFLAKYPREAADGVGNLEFSVVTAAALMVRAADLEKHEGFSAIFVNGMEDIDLCLRMTEEGTRHFVVEPKSVVQHFESKTQGRGKFIPDNRREFMRLWKGKLPSPENHLYSSLGFEIVGVSSDGGEIAAPKVQVRSIEKNSLTWGIKYAAVGGVKGDSWGDTAFVESLKEAVKRTGGAVNTYRHGANLDYDHAPDDINLVIRGLDRVAPIPGQVNVLWVISHPEAITKNELMGFDLVYAASEPWALRMSSKFGIDVRVLLQATDVTRFNVEGPLLVPSRPPVFVGSVHPGRRRNVVETAFGSGIPIEVIGKGWRDRLPSNILRADYVENSDLCSIYRSASRVLADHWIGMAEEGFIQNRVFDAVACGSRVISDFVPGIEEKFGGAVRVYRDSEELRYLCSEAANKEFPSDEELLGLAEKCRLEHSFDQRVKVIKADVEQILETRRKNKSLW